MAGKWHTLRGELPAFTQEPSRQAEVDKVKSSTPEEGGLLGFNRLQLCSELHDADIEKKDLEDQLKDINTRREAINQLLLPTMEDTGESKFTNSYGTFYLRDEPYSKVVDKQQYLKWIVEKGLEALLAVPYQSTNAQVKSLLEEGEATPPGIEVFLKTTVGRRSA